MNPATDTSRRGAGPKVSHGRTWKRLRDWAAGADARDPARVRVPARDLVNIVCNLATMVRSGLSLPRALGTLTKEHTLKQHAWMLNLMRRRIENGDSFSRALAAFPRTFPVLIVQQVRVAEQTGELPATLERITQQLRRRGNVRRQLVKRLSYPALVATAGLGLVIFMMTVVVPQFEAVYADAAELPWATVVVSGLSRFVYRNALWGLALAVGVLVGIQLLRRHATLGVRFDRALLRLPVAGHWIRDYAVLQFMDSVGTMIESGFVPLEAISASVDSVGNRAVQRSIRKLRSALVRGERLSDQLSHDEDLFPPTVSQLMSVGETTGDLARATRGIREHLEQRLQSRVETVLGMIEPVLTVLLAIMIGFIVLAIYLPMFGMIDAME